MERGMEYQHPLIKRVKYAALNEEAVVLSCLKWLGVEAVNVGQMMHMNIQSDLAWNIAALAAKAA
jgi:hypothetical protein